MILHTIINEYDIMQAQNAIAVPIAQAINGGIIEYTVTPQGKEISRLFSTDPYLYLSNQYQPNTVLLKTFNK